MLSVSILDSSSAAGIDGSPDATSPPPPTPTDSMVELELVAAAGVVAGSLPRLTSGSVFLRQISAEMASSKLIVRSASSWAVELSLGELLLVFVVVLLLLLLLCSSTTAGVALVEATAASGVEVPALELALLLVLCGVGAVLSPIGSLLGLLPPDFRLLFGCEDRCGCCGMAAAGEDAGEPAAAAAAAATAAASRERVTRVVAVAGVGVEGFLATEPGPAPPVPPPATAPLSEEELRAEGEAVLVSFSLGLSGSAVSAGAIVGSIAFGSRCSI